MIFYLKNGVNASVAAKVQYTEKLERVVDTITDSSIKIILVNYLLHQRKH